MGYTVITVRDWPKPVTGDLKMKKAPKKYDTVCMNGNSDAAVFRVVEVDGRNIGLVDATSDRPNQRVQWMDMSCMEPATRGQLQNAGLV